MNMFARRTKNYDDIKKYGQKILDYKKDTASRLKYLKQFIDMSDSIDVKIFFEHNHSQIYNIFYEQFYIFESNIKPRIKPNKEELDTLLCVFHKLLLLQPERLRGRWQAHSIGQILEKLLHIGNAKSIRFFGTRMFLIWYQILKDNKTKLEEIMFQKLIQGFEVFYNSHLHHHTANLSNIELMNVEAQKIFNNNSSASFNYSDGKTYPVEITPLIAIQQNEHVGNWTAESFRVILEFMQKDCMTIEWNDKFYYQKCYEFLFDEIKRYYLIYIFPNAFSSTPLTQTPAHKQQSELHQNDEKKQVQLQCKEEIVKWLINILLIETDMSEDTSSSSLSYMSNSVMNSSMISGTETLKASSQMTQSMMSTTTTGTLVANQDDLGYFNEFDVFASSNGSGSTSDMSRHLVQKILLSNSVNVNLIHEILRQTFLLSFDDSQTVRKVLDAYKKWFLKEALLPAFMQEPTHSTSSISSLTSLSATQIAAQKTQELLNKYIQQQFIPLELTNKDTRVGFTRSLQIFFIYSSNLFHNRHNFHRDKITHICLHAFDIYKILINKLQLDFNTWNLIINVLIRISDNIFNSESLLNNRNDTIISNLFKSITEVLLLAFEKASINIQLPNDLWDQLMNLLSSATMYNDVVDKWLENIDYLIKKAIKFNYGIDVNLLDIFNESANEKKREKLRKKTVIDTASSMSLSTASNMIQATMIETLQNIQEIQIPEELNINILNSNNSNNNNTDEVDATSLVNSKASDSNIADLIAAHDKLVSDDDDNVDKSATLKANVNIPDFSIDTDQTQNKSLDDLVNNKKNVDSDTLSNAYSNTTQLDLSNENTNDENMSDIRSSTSSEQTQQQVKKPPNYLIKRILGSIGNINEIKDPQIHRRVFEFLYKKLELFTKLKEKLNLDLNILPAIMDFSPWYFEAIYQLPHQFSSGKLMAYKSLCFITTTLFYNVNEQEQQLNEDYLDLFYLTIHNGLRSADNDIINCIIQSTNTKFWHCMLSSSTLLIKDFVDACNYISDSSNGPKKEAAQILGCFTGLTNYFTEIQILNDAQIKNDTQLTTDLLSTDSFKDLLIHNLTNFSLNFNDIDLTTRYIISCALTCFLYEEIVTKHFNKKRLEDSIKQLFANLDLNFNNTNLLLVKMTCDNLRFLAQLAEIIFEFNIQFAIDIISNLNNCLVKLTNNSHSYQTNDDYSKVVISTLFALLDWYMYSPLAQLKDLDRSSLLNNMFKLLVHVCTKFRNCLTPQVEHIYLTAKYIIAHLLTQLNHFPFGLYGTSKIVSSVNEYSDQQYFNDDYSIYENPCIQYFTVNNQYLITFIELQLNLNEQLANFDLNLNQNNFKLASTLCRFIIRDNCGKYCWDCCALKGKNECFNNLYILKMPQAEQDSVNDSLFVNDLINIDTEKYLLIPLDGLTEEQQSNNDILDIILSYISNTSPECRIKTDSQLNLNFLKQNEIKKKIMTQSVKQLEQIKSKFNLDLNNFMQLSNTEIEYDHKDQQQIQNSNFALCKSFVHQLGLLSWEKRQSFNLLHKSQQLLRELKSLDDQTCRETHKIAVIYIGIGQEDKQSILSNQNGSKDYEDFLNGLAWNIDLETHEGFMGGLPRNHRSKATPYYANSSTEVLFHVSTRMNNPNDENKISKWRHLGNDCVMIIWSDHKKDFQRNILATEFADVLICIYPLKNCLYRIKIDKKAKIDNFGPLFDGAIVTKQILSVLVRSTALNASRVLLSRTNGFKDFYVHRSHAINNIVKTQTEQDTFEQFITDIYSPLLIEQNNFKKDTDATNLNTSSSSSIKE